MVFFGKNDKPFWRKVIILLIKFIRKSHDAKVQNQSQILKGEATCQPPANTPSEQNFPFL
jgi:hypothetical protein